ncbi:MAG: DUF5455 family protein [Rhodospirillales bacterium]|nr:DUF5455 family protein [Acetobacter sp.]
MPLLGALLLPLFSGIVAWLMQWFTRKVAFGLAAVAASSALTLALFVLMRGTISAVLALSSGLPSMFAQAMGMAVPPAASACLGAYISIWVACTAYTWQRDQLHLFAKSS